MRKEREYTYLGTTTGMCRSCRELVPSRVLAEDGKVYQERLCPRCGNDIALIAGDLEWYARMQRERITPRRKNVSRRPVERGCPHDCGPCAFHEGTCNIPVVSVTNACDLRCPICFTYNREDQRYFMPIEEMRAVVEQVIECAGPVDLINITGGEPTLHPEILTLLDECRRPEIGRITMNTNGIRLAEDEILCRDLADLGVYVVLSFNTFDPETSVMLHGRDVTSEKLAALDNLEKHGIGTTLLNVMVPGVNDHEIGKVLDLAIQRPNVRSVTVQTMTYTGEGGGRFYPRVHLPVDVAAHTIERETGGTLRAAHFFPFPSAHPLCYGIGYFLRTRNGLVSFTDLFEPEDLRELMGGGYLMRPLAEHGTQFEEVIDRLWASGAGEPVLEELRRLVTAVYPAGVNRTDFERQREAEKHLLTVYLHAHMDEDTFDVARVAVCPDRVPDDRGRMIPACAYNLFYRMHDHRFWKEA